MIAYDPAAFLLDDSRPKDFIDNYTQKLFETADLGGRGHRSGKGLLRGLGSGDGATHSWQLRPGGIHTY